MDDGKSIMKFKLSDSESALKFTPRSFAFSLFGLNSELLRLQNMWRHFSTGSPFSRMMANKQLKILELLDLEA